MNQIENSITFKLKTGYYFKLLTPENMRLLGSTKSKTTKGENNENVPGLQITESVLVYFSVINNDYKQDSRVLFQINCLVNY